MARLGYHLSSEEHPAADLVGYARAAEEAGFSFALISDHFHPWIRHQGHSPFVWSVLGAIAQVTTTLRVGTGVTAPIMRIHPGIEEPPPIIMAAGGKRATKLAAEKADGLLSVVADRSALEAFDQAGGAGKPRYIKLAVCYDEDEDEARRLVHKQWPIDAMPGRLLTEQRLPQDFEAIVELVTERQAADSVLCGPDPQPHIEKIEGYVNDGYDHVYVHQIGSNQKGFFSFYEQQVMPQLKGLESN